MRHTALTEGAVQQAIAHGPGLAGAGTAPAHRIGGLTGCPPVLHAAAVVAVNAGEPIKTLLAANGGAAAAWDIALHQGLRQL